MGPTKDSTTTEKLLPVEMVHALTILNPGGMERKKGGLCTAEGQNMLKILIFKNLPLLTERVSD